MEYQFSKTLPTIESTHELGVALGKKLKGTETIGLVGELGAGKTHLVKGLAEGFGVAGNVTSPTFVLERIYRNPERSRMLHHFDTYRIGYREFANLGIYDLFGHAVVVVEWADKVLELMPDDTIWIQLTVSGETSRKITIKTNEDRRYLTQNL
jgi:tRNA threonylcarbamoyladenosine biosynthesis protein TsaE